MSMKSKKQINVIRMDSFCKTMTLPKPLYVCVYVGVYVCMYIVYTFKHP